MDFVAAINDINEINNVEHEDRIQRVRLRDAYNPFEFYNDTEFRSRYRMTKESVQFICDMTRDALQRPTQRHGSIPVELQVLTAFHFYATRA